MSLRPAPVTSVMGWTGISDGFTGLKAFPSPQQLKASCQSKVAEENEALSSSYQADFRMLMRGVGSKGKTVNVPAFLRLHHAGKGQRPWSQNLVRILDLPLLPSGVRHLREVLGVLIYKTGLVVSTLLYLFI